MSRINVEVNLILILNTDEKRIFLISNKLNRLNGYGSCDLLVQKGAFAVYINLPGEMFVMNGDSM